jgi:hypothetical protein
MIFPLYIKEKICMRRIIISLIKFLERIVNNHSQEYRKKIVKELINDGISTLKVISKDGEELDMIVLKDDYTYFTKVCNSKGREKDNLDKFFELIKY